VGALSTRVAHSKVANVGNRFQLQAPRCTYNVKECYTGHWMRFCEHGTDPSGSMKLRNFYLLKDCWLFKKTLPRWVIN